MYVTEYKEAKATITKLKVVNDSVKIRCKINEGIKKNYQTRGTETICVAEIFCIFTHRIIRNLLKFIINSFRLFKIKESNTQY